MLGEYNTNFKITFSAASGGELNPQRLKIALTKFLTCACGNQMLLSATGLEY
jgi:hypothetical protein